MSCLQALPHPNAVSSVPYCHALLSPGGEGIWPVVTQPIRGAQGPEPMTPEPALLTTTSPLLVGTRFGRTFAFAFLNICSPFQIFNDSIPPLLCDVPCQPDWTQLPPLLQGLLVGRALPPRPPPQTALPQGAKPEGTAGPTAGTRGHSEPKGPPGSPRPGANLPSPPLNP